MPKKIRQPHLAIEVLRDLGKRKLTLGLLFLNVLVAIAIVQTSHLSRQQIIQQDSLLREKDNLDLEWRKLLLEQRALAEHSRVMHLAEKKLNMHWPSADEEVVVRLP
ncbi:cell division protein FtsL [Flocculibacter collagenilyticus]|uniref:cell division protein FtsL n=1 Tax=Flocculibacter collagenilyticus TaxID=2744479 RepID=UPI0018F54A30|nr:cell division protein FtsL [Flocculibacter collagenilyticus]